MRRLIATIVAAGAVSLMVASGVSADPIAFEFSATCSGLGSVILTNAGPSHGAGAPRRRNEHRRAGSGGRHPFVSALAEGARGGNNMHVHGWGPAGQHRAD